MPTSIGLKRPMMFVRFLMSIAVASYFTMTASAQPTEAPLKTRVIILGVEHSGQLVARAARAAIMEAFIARAAPDAICVERDPANLAVNYFYEFTYEQTGIAIPYAREHQIALCPIDWVPSREDSILGWGFDLDSVPPVRPAKGFASFTTFDAEALKENLFWAEAPNALTEWDAFVAKPEPWPGPEMARRLFLYRTAFQARRIGTAAHERPGRTILVMVGADHVRDLKSLLIQDAAIDLVDVSTVGLPTEAEIAMHEKSRFMLAALNFNLLGMQSAGNPIDWAWMREMIAALSASNDRSLEVDLFRLRLARLTGSATPVATLAAYRKLLETVPGDARFTWTGVQDAKRIDSFFDPFGNLTIRERLQLEIARECYATGRIVEANGIKTILQRSLSPSKTAQMSYYWMKYVETQLKE